MASGSLPLAGNHERQMLELRPGRSGPSDQYAHAQLTEAKFTWGRTLKAWHRFSDDVYLRHGSPFNDHEYLLETRNGSALRLATAPEIATRLNGNCALVIACGHAHVPRTIRLGASLLLNPVSIGLQAYSDD